MNSKSIFKNRAVTLVVAAFASSAFAVDAFDPATNLLTLDSVTTGGVTYRNVAVTVGAYDLLGVGGGTPGADTFNPANNVLVLGSVAFQGAVYNNVSIKINAYTILSVGGTATPGTLAAPNYPGEMAGYLAKLNTYRTQCGMPALSQNTVLEVAASNIPTASATVNQVTMATNAGYAAPTTVGGINSQYSSNSENNDLVGQLELQTTLMDYQGMLNLMRPYTEIGMVSNLGKAGSIHQRGAQVMLGNPVVRNTTLPLTFPCANTMDIAPYASSIGGFVSYVSGTAATLSSDGTQRITGAQGTPIAVFANPGDTLVLTAATVALQGGAGVPVLVNLGSPRTRYAYEGFVWPQQNLLPNAAYDVVIVGTVNGVGFSRNFMFRTGAAIPQYLP